MVDDSIHVMLRHDQKVAKKKGGNAAGTQYVPRAEHPLLQKAAQHQDETAQDAKVGENREQQQPQDGTTQDTKVGENREQEQQQSGAEENSTSAAMTTTESTATAAS